MGENSESNIIFNIQGSTVQIAPHATMQQQNFYGDRFAERMLQSEDKESETRNDDEQRLAIYIKDEEARRSYISNLTACQSAKEVGEVVATMCENENTIHAELIAKKEFINLLLPFLTNVASGKGVDNLRLYINNAWEARKKAIRRANR